MMTDREILKAAHAELLRLQADPRSTKLWLTARVLAMRMRRRLGQPELTQDRLYQILIEEAKREPGTRRIRNSKYPSLRTLEVLWGAISNDDRLTDIQVPPPNLEPSWSEAHPRSERDGVAEPDEAGADDERPTLFVSYNCNDRAAARDLVGMLERRHHSVWFAEARIQPGQEINAAVVEALGEARRHLLFLSWQALDSLWVGKEFLVGATMELEQTLVVRGDDERLMRRVLCSIRGEPGGVNEIGVDPDAASHRALVKFHETVQEQLVESDRPVYVHPPPPAELDEPRLRQLSEFPDP